MSALSVVIPNYNGRYHLQRLLPSLCRFAPPATQILVVDDASTDDSLVWIRSHFPQVELVSLPHNGGFCQAINAGIAHARGEILQLLNNDTEIVSGWPDAALSHFQDPTVGSVAPLVLQMANPSIIDSAGQQYHLCGWAYDRGHGQVLQDRYLTSTEVFGPSGSSGFYRREALLRTGGLLPEYGAYFEDTDLAFRLRWAGYRCIYEPGTRILHAGHASYGQQSSRVIRHLARNEELAYWINLPPRELLWAFLPHLAFQGVRLIRHAITGRLGPYLRGKGDALWAWNQIRQRRRQVQQLAKQGFQPRELQMQDSWSVLGQGITWLRQRRCA